jgi:hypothetical protein
MSKHLLGGHSQVSPSYLHYHLRTTAKDLSQVELYMVVLAQREEGNPVCICVPMATVTNDHKFGGLKQQKVILSHSSCQKL